MVIGLALGVGEQGMVARLGMELEWLAKLLGRARKAIWPACSLGHETGGAIWFVCRGIQKGICWSQ